jgi:hypothetical protein
MALGGQEGGGGMALGGQERERWSALKESGEWMARLNGARGELGRADLVDQRIVLAVDDGHDGAV